VVIVKVPVEMMVMVKVAVVILAAVANDMLIVMSS